VSEAPLPDPIETASSEATAGMSLDQFTSAARAGVVRCPGPTFTEDAVFVAGVLAESAISTVVIARWHVQHTAIAGAKTDTPPPVTVLRTLLSRQTDLPRELALLPDDCRLIAGPMMVWRSGDRLVAALYDSR
jgi:hypothetical protein